MTCSGKVGPFLGLKGPIECADIAHIELASNLSWWWAVCPGHARYTNTPIIKYKPHTLQHIALCPGRAWYTNTPIPHTPQHIALCPGHAKYTNTSLPHTLHNIALYPGHARSTAYTTAYWAVPRTRYLYQHSYTAYTTAYCARCTNALIYWCREQNISFNNVNYTVWYDIRYYTVRSILYRICCNYAVHLLDINCNISI